MKTDPSHQPPGETYRVAQLTNAPQETNGHTYPENCDPERTPNHQDYRHRGRGKNN